MRSNRGGRQPEVRAARIFLEATFVSKSHASGAVISRPSGTMAEVRLQVATGGAVDTAVLSGMSGTCRVRLRRNSAFVFSSWTGRRTTSPIDMPFCRAARQNQDLSLESILRAKMLALTPGTPLCPGAPSTTGQQSSRAIKRCGARPGPDRKCMQAIQAVKPTGSVTPLERQHAVNVFASRQAMVIGPTPPGTGVIAPAT